jgi:phosphotransferase system  glucose/maltose/N-acetylglucosamine-specific IIC component
VLIIVFTFVPPFAMAPYLITSAGILISILSVLSYKAVGSRSKNISSIDVVKDVFSHYKQPLVFIYAIGVILTAFSVMGAVPGIAAIAAVLAMYYGTDVFNPATAAIPVKQEGYSFEGGGASLTRKLKQMSKSFSSK